jgi:hypothetical protein
MVMLTLIFQRLAEAFRRWRLSRAPRGVEGKADYTYTNMTLETTQTRNGDTYESILLDVRYQGAKIGTMKIWHNRFGAFAHFTDTRIWK